MGLTRQKLVIEPNGGLQRKAVVEFPIDSGLIPSVVSDGTEKARDPFKRQLVPARLMLA